MFRRIVLIVAILLLAGCSADVTVAPIPVSKLEQGSSEVFYYHISGITFPDGRNFPEGVSHISFECSTVKADWEFEWTIEKHVEIYDSWLQPPNWMKVPFSREQEKIVLKNGEEFFYEMSKEPHYQHTIKLDLSLLEFPLDAGIYRVILKGAENINVSGAFSVGDVDMLNEEDLRPGVSDSEIHNDRVSLSAMNPTYSADVESILYTYESIDGMKYSTGCGQSLEKYIDGKWYHLYVTGGYEAVKSGLPGYQLMYLSSYLFPLTEGRYRIIKAFNTEPYKKEEQFFAADEFCVVKDRSKPSQANFVTVEKNLTGSWGIEVKLTNKSGKKFYMESYVNLAPDPREYYTRTHDHPYPFEPDESRLVTIVGLDKVPSKKKIVPIWLEDGTEYYIDLSRMK